MKLCFLQKQAFPYFGVMSLAGSLQAAGIESDAVIANLEQDFVSTLKECNPDIIALSVLSTEHEWLEQTARLVKEALPSVPLVVGGIHAILYPEAILALPHIDFVCTGDGEEILPELCIALRDGTTVEGIKGIGYRTGNRIVINERAELLTDLGRWREDRMVYYRRYDLLRNDELKQFIASRGCPYRCSFCFNERLHAIFSRHSSLVRKKPPLQLIEEIEKVRDIAPIGAIFFADDLFASDKQWLKEFSRLYQERVGIPFMCITRADRMDEETAELLKDAGCHTISFGVESGNEQLRMKLLNKQVSDASIMRCAALLHDRGIRVQTSNMFCLPDETLEEAISTIRLNIRIKADFVFTPLFMPFPGTQLAEYCIEKGYLPAGFAFRDLPQSFLGRSILNIPERQQIENLQRIAYFLVKFPALLDYAEPVIRRITASWCYYPFLFLGTLLRYKSERGLSFWGAARFLWRFRKSF
jgi:anaerobic magnesium-protoporphyrin IX monomethyl ester cyclase